MYIYMCVCIHTHMTCMYETVLSIFMYVYMYVCRHACIYIIHTLQICSYGWMYACTNDCMHMYICYMDVYIYICILADIHECIYVCICECMYLSLHICRQTCIWIHLYICIGRHRGICICYTLCLCYTPSTPKCGIIYPPCVAIFH